MRSPSARKAVWKRISSEFTWLKPPHGHHEPPAHGGSCPTHRASDPLVHVCPLSFYWHWCHTHQLPTEPFSAPFPYDSWVCACTCAGHTCTHREQQGLQNLEAPGRCWMSSGHHLWKLLGIAHGAHGWSSIFASQILNDLELQWEHAELWACVWTQIGDVLFSPCSPALGTALSLQHHLAEPAPHYHGLAVTTGEAWASLCPHSKFSRFYWLSVTICLYASFWLCLILWIGSFLLFWRNCGLSVSYLLLFGFF